MSQGKNVSPDAPIISRPGSPAISAVGTSLVIHEWRGCGPPYMHIHRSDDEAWHVLEGSLRFRLADGEIDAPAGTTVFVPAGSPHTYWGLAVGIARRLCCGGNPEDEIGPFGLRA
jgi:mannose-6-phosphate isomerase-like protein (cupin superfamily)